MKQKLLPESLTPGNDLREALETAVREELDVTGLFFEGGDAPELILGTTEIQKCLFRNCCLTDCRFRGTGFGQVFFEGCDLSGAVFQDCGLREVLFRDCRMLGTVMRDCALLTVTLESVSGRYIQLSGGKLRDVEMTDCRFSGGAFQSLKCQRPTVRNCDFTGCDFRSTELGSFDFSTSDISGCTWSPGLLRGMTVNTQQAVDLSRLLGLNIVL